MTYVGEHAVVLGASMGGLVAARVLADHYRTVTVVERDALPSSSAQRRGVPQGRHAHALLAGGSQILEQLFPGFLAELVANGCPFTTTATCPSSMCRLAGTCLSGRESVTFGRATNSITPVAHYWRVRFVGASAR